MFVFYTIYSNYLRFSPWNHCKSISVQILIFDNLDIIVDWWLSFRCVNYWLLNIWCSEIPYLPSFLYKLVSSNVFSSLKHWVPSLCAFSIFFCLHKNHFHVNLPGEMFLFEMNAFTLLYGLLVLVEIFRLLC